MVNINSIEQLIFDINNSNFREKEKEIIIEKVMELYPTEEFADDREIARIRELEKRKEKRRLNELYNINSQSVTRNNDGRLIRGYKSKIRKASKKKAESKIKNHKGYISNGGSYKKLTMYQGDVRW